MFYIGILRTVGRFLERRDIFFVIVHHHVHISLIKIDGLVKRGGVVVNVLGQPLTEVTAPPPSKPRPALTSA